MLIAAQPLHGDLDTISESMDDLVAAAVVLTMLVDSDADDDMEQEVNAGECNGDLLQSTTAAFNLENKENEGDLPEPRGLGAANKQVMADPSNLRANPSDRSDTPCHHPINQLDRQARRAVRAGAMAPALILVPRTSSTASGDFIGSR